MRTLTALVAFALLIGDHTVRCQYGDDDADMEDGGYGGGGGGGGGYGGDDEEPPSPPPDGGDMKELLGVADFDEFLDNTDASIIAGFTDKEIVDPNAVLPEGWDEEEDGEWEAPVIENPAFTTVKEISSSLYGYRFAYTSAPEVLEKLKCKKSGIFLYRSPKFVSAKDGDRPRERFPSDKPSESAVSNWLKAKAQPLVGLFSHGTKERYTGPTLVIFMNLDFDKNDKSVAYVLKRARKVAGPLKGKLSIAVAALSDMNYELGDYGLESKKPTADILMGIRSSDSSPSYYSGSAYFEASGKSAAFTADTLSSFANAYLGGELSAYVKPDPPPYDDKSEDDDAPEGDGEEDEGEGEEDSKDEM